VGDSGLIPVFCKLLPTDVGSWEDLPASYHNGAAGFSFADGHSETHPWMDPGTLAPVTTVEAQSGGADPPADQQQDRRWPAFRSSVQIIIGPPEDGSSSAPMKCRGRDGQAGESILAAQFPLFASSMVWSSFMPPLKVGNNETRNAIARGGQSRVSPVKSKANQQQDP
jgi:prepilin-type processing-associated H-X9-DG protein